ncbi:MAG: response regulator [Phycisphaerae bacterium]|nr:response regulator [Phycisphaerae bacterium]
MANPLADRRILIVDDDPDILGSIELALRSAGAITRTAPDGSAAVSAIHEERPDLIVLDMMLPKVSGFLVMEKLQELEAPPPVIMVTANQGRRHQAYAESLGIGAYFLKPVPLQRLVVKAAELIAQHEKA